MAGTDPIAIIGGAEIYHLFEQDADRIELTQIHAEYDGDTHMALPDNGWREIMREDHPAQNDRPAYSFVTYHRHQDGPMEGALK